MSHGWECVNSPTLCLTIIIVFYFSLKYEVIFGYAEAPHVISLSTVFPFCSWLFKGRHFVFPQRLRNTTQDCLMLQTNKQCFYSAPMLSNVQTSTQSRCILFPLSKSTIYVSSLFQTAGRAPLMWSWYLLLLTYRAVGLWHSLSQQWSHISKLCFGIERSIFSRSSINTARPDWGECITARKGSAVWQFTLFSCYYDGNAALFTTAHTPKRSLHLTIAQTAWKITAEQPVNIGKWVSSSESMFRFIKKH